MWIFISHFSFIPCLQEPTFAADTMLRRGWRNPISMTTKAQTTRSTPSNTQQQFMGKLLLKISSYLSLSIERYYSWGESEDEWRKEKRLKFVHSTNFQLQNGEKRGKKGQKCGGLWWCCRRDFEEAKPMQRKASREAPHLSKKKEEKWKKDDDDDGKEFFASLVGGSMSKKLAVLDNERQALGFLLQKSSYFSFSLFFSIYPLSLLCRKNDVILSTRMGGSHRRLILASYTQRITMMEAAEKLKIKLCELWWWNEDEHERGSKQFLF